MADTRRRVREYVVSTSAAASATHAGSTPSGDSAAKPTSISPTTTSGTTGRSTAGVGSVRCGGAARSRAKHSRWPTYSTAMTASQTGAISAAKPRKESEGSDGRASRFVRLDTGSSREAVLASRAQA